jgi:hypothetical protein
MPSILNEALEWLDRAEQAREVAGQLNDPGARKAVLELAESFERLARAAAAPSSRRDPRSTGESAVNGLSTRSPVTGHRRTRPATGYPSLASE